MITDFILPDIGEGIVECELVEWLVEEGDRIEEDQPVCDVSTDKALVQIPSMLTGKVVKLYHQKGETAKVHKPLFAIEVEDEGGQPEAAEASSDKPAEEPAPREQPAASEQPAAPAPKPAARDAARPVPASPAVRRVARELGVDLNEVAGSGKKGRVFKTDVEAHSEGRGPAKPEPASAPAPAADEGDNIVKREPLKGVRAAMARQMSASASTIPHFTYSDDVDLTELLPVYQQIRANYKEELRITLMPFFIKALSLTLKVFPQLNATFDDDSNEIRYHHHHNIGVAVDGALGLMVPNLKAVESQSLVAVAKALNELVEAARVGRIPPEDLKGGTITISNIGAIGGTVATPIINKPELAIVALGATRRQPRFDAEDNVVARHIMPISWAADHRIVDGATAARFSNHWKRLLEQPALMLAELG